MLMHSRPRNRIVQSLATVFLPFYVNSLFVIPIHSFGISPQPSMQIPGSLSLRTTSTLYYLDRDPLMEMASFQRHESAGEILIADPQSILQNHTKTCDSALQLLRKSDRSTKPTQSHTKTWNIRYKDLVEFKREHGHCLVPQHYPPNPKLGLWVMAQRRYYKLQSRKKGDKKLSLRHKHRIRLLEHVGFVFDVKRRGPRLPKIHHMSRCTEDSGNEVHAIEDFVGFLIENKYTDEEKRKAWKLRFRMYEK
ncbi:hypothetical protein ACHAW6_007082 [Cyclotella cf. meneghiniana]